jgi:hypothetical protein
MRVRSIARTLTVALMGLAVLVATADGFAQSYAGLYRWAIEHGLSGWKADSFPLLVDLFVAVGEMGLFLLAIDGHRLRKSLMSWVDLLVPMLVAASGWGASLVFNVGSARHVFSFEATAAVPPLASMIGLLVLLRTLHRYVAQAEAEATAVPLALAVAPDDLSLAEAMEDTPPALLAWLKGEDQVHVPAVPDPHQVRAASEFGEQVRAGQVPGVREIKKRLQLGTDNARQVRTYLADLADSADVGDGPLGASEQVSAGMGR